MYTSSQLRHGFDRYVLVEGRGKREAPGVVTVEPRHAATLVGAMARSPERARLLRILRVLRGPRVHDDDTRILEWAVHSLVTNCTRLVLIRYERRHYGRAPLLATDEDPEAEPTETIWLGLELLDADGVAHAQAAYVLRDESGRTTSGSLDASGAARISRLQPGTYFVEFPSYAADLCHAGPLDGPTPPDARGHRVETEADNYFTLAYSELNSVPTIHVPVPDSASGRANPCIRVDLPTDEPLIEAFEFARSARSDRSDYVSCGASVYFSCAGRRELEGQIRVAGPNGPHVYHFTMQAAVSADESVDSLVEQANNALAMRDGLVAQSGKAGTGEGRAFHSELTRISFRQITATLDAIEHELDEDEAQGFYERVGRDLPTMLFGE